MTASSRTFAWATCLALLGAAPGFGQALPPIKTADYDQRGAFRVNGNQLIPMYETDISVRKEILTINPFFFSIIIRAAKAEDVYAARTPESNMASQRQRGCSQNGLSQVNWLSCTICSYPPQALLTNTSNCPRSSLTR